MKITAAVITAPGGEFQMRQADLDEPRPDEILVRVVGVGLCHTDLDAAGGGWGFRFPAVLGHEGSGIVERVGSAVRKVAPGDHVAMTFRSCGECKRCLQGSPAYCLKMPLLNYTGMRPDGSTPISIDAEPATSSFFGQSSFANYALAYERNVVKVPDDVPLELMGPLGCGIQTGAGGIMRSMACETGSSLLVLGGGAVGLSAVMGGVLRGCSPIVVLEPHAARRKMALELGATHALDPKEIAALPAAIREICPDGMDYIFDTTGIPKLLQDSMECLAPHGCLGVVGIPPPEAPLPGNMRTAITLGFSVMGIIEGDSDPDTFIPELIGHYRAGKFPFDKLVQTYPLASINAAIKDQHDGKCVKAVLLP